MSEQVDFPKRSTIPKIEKRAFIDELIDYFQKRVNHTYTSCECTEDYECAIHKEARFLIKLERAKKMEGMLCQAKLNRSHQPISQSQE